MHFAFSDQSWHSTVLCNVPWDLHLNTCQLSESWVLALGNLSFAKGIVEYSTKFTAHSRCLACKKRNISKRTVLPQTECFLKAPNPSREEHLGWVLTLSLVSVVSPSSVARRHICSPAIAYLQPLPSLYSSQCSALSGISNLFVHCWVEHCMRWGFPESPSLAKETFRWVWAAHGTDIAGPNEACPPDGLQKFENFLCAAQHWCQPAKSNGWSTWLTDLDNDWKWSAQAQRGKLEYLDSIWVSDEYHVLSANITLYSSLQLEAEGKLICL